MKIKIIFLLLPLLFTSAYSQEYGAGLKLSTLGVSAEAVRSFGNNFNAKLGLSFLSFNYNGGKNTDDYTYKADMKFFAISALADWFPFQNGWRLTGGVIFNISNKTKAKLTPTKTYIVGGDYYTPEKLGNVDVDIKMNKVAPYLGMGFGNPMAGDNGLKFIFDIGAYYHGSPKADLTANGLLEPSAAPDQEEKLSNNISWFKFYPVVSLGLIYKF
jgi:hypothetical protein